MEYLQSPKSKGCIFCELPSEEPQRERLLLQRSRYVFVLLNRYPYAPGHLMVVPYAHEARLERLEPEALTELMVRISDGARILESALQCDGLNIGLNLGVAAGAGFAEHLHFHLVPRWADDTNFMTVVGDTRVIPKALENMFEELLPGFEELGPS